MPDGRKQGIAVGAFGNGQGFGVQGCCGLRDGRAKRCDLRGRLGAGGLPCGDQKRGAARRKDGQDHRARLTDQAQRLGAERAGILGIGEQRMCLYACGIQVYGQRSCGFPAMKIQKRSGLTCVHDGIQKIACVALCRARGEAQPPRHLCGAVPDTKGEFGQAGKVS